MAARLDNPYDLLDAAADEDLDALATAKLAAEGGVKRKGKETQQQPRPAAPVPVGAPGWDEPPPAGFAPVTPPHKGHGPRSAAGSGAARGGKAAAERPRPQWPQEGEEGPLGDAVDWSVEWGGRGSLNEAPGNFVGAGGRGTRVGPKDQGTGGHPRPRSPARGARVGKHEYERHDGTGRGHETEKRGGGGRANWGPAGEEQVIQSTSGETTIIPDDMAAGLVADAPPLRPDEDVDAGVDGATAEAKEMSLEEYEAQMASRRAAVQEAMKKGPSQEIKVDMDEFKGMKTYVRKDAEEEVPSLVVSSAKAKAGENSKDKAEGSAKEGKASKKQVINLEVNFTVAPSEERGKAGWRGRPGGRGRGDDRERPDFGRVGGRRGGRLGGGAGPSPVVVSPEGKGETAGVEGGGEPAAEQDLGQGEGGGDGGSAVQSGNISGRGGGRAGGGGRSAAPAEGEGLTTEALSVDTPEGGRTSGGFSGRGRGGRGGGGQQGGNGGGRGNGRGGGRGGRGRGEASGAPSKSPELAIDDSTAFPSLS